MKNRIIEAIWAITLFLTIIGIAYIIQKQPCLKSQTSAIEINGELKDYLICVSENLPVILKEYEKN